MKKININVQYEAGHSYNEEWQLTEYHCPSCGSKQVWNNNSGGGDMYVGEKLRCNGCSCEFYLPDGVKPSRGDEGDDWQTKQRAEVFKAI